MKIFLIILTILLTSTICFSGRKITLGFEASGTGYQGSSYNNGDGVTLNSFGGHTPGNKRSGVSASGHLGNGSALSQEVHPFYGGVATGTVYGKFWLHLDIDIGPSADAIIWFIDNGVSLASRVELMWNIDQTMSLRVGDTTRATTGGAVARGHYILVSFNTAGLGTGNSTSMTIDGTTLTDTHRVSGAPVRTGIGWWTAQSGGLGVARVIFFDDMVINDASGSFENSAPDDSSHIYAMYPVSDNTINGWKTGDLGTTNLWAAVDNYNFFINLGHSTETTTSQIVDTTNSSTDNYDANLIAIDTYVGFTPSDTVASTQTIRFAQAFVRHGEHDSAGAKLGGFQLMSNPADVGETGFTFGDDAKSPKLKGVHDIDNSNATLLAAVDSLSWRTKFGAPIYFPTINRTTATVLRVGKRTQTGSDGSPISPTHTVDVDAIGMMIEVGSAQGLPAGIRVYQDDD